MARINTNVPAIIAQRTLRQNQRDLNVSLERLSSGLRINRGADDPAGLINSEHLRAEIAGVNKAIGNSERAINIIATTEGALNEVAALLIDIQGLVVEAANDGAMSPEEIEANQLQIDSAIESITRIANTATFAGRKLLDGSLDYVTSGVDSTAISTLKLHGVQFGSRNYVPVQMEVTTSAQKAQLQYRTSQVTGDISIAVRGNAGTTAVQLVGGQHVSAVLAAINASSESNGVEAYYINPSNINSGIAFQSTGYGSDQMVQIETLAGSAAFNTVNTAGGGDNVDYGQDAVATINGARAVGRGLDINLNTATLDLTLTLDENFGLNSTSFAVTGGGALFQLGPDVNPNQQVNVGVQSVAAAKLGNTAIGFLSQIGTGEAYEVIGTASQRATANNIVTEAIGQVSVLRGRLGAFERNTLQTNINSLGIAMENLTASESAIRDTDFAYETSRLTRNQILVSAGTSVLSLANTTTQSALSLLGG